MLTKKSFYLELALVCALLLLILTARTAMTFIYGGASAAKDDAADKTRDEAKAATKTEASGKAASGAEEKEAGREAPGEPGPEAAGEGLDSAAELNNRLKTEVEWSFGGKAQRGWQIYTPLIQHLIGTDGEEGSREFAVALSRWERSVGLKPDGVLDRETLMKMVSTWQGRRLMSSASPPEDQLLTVSAAEFWDTSRPEELRKVERNAYAAYRRMIAAAVADPSSGLKGTSAGELAPAEKYLKIVSAFRSRAYQEQLRRASPGSGRAGLAVNSPHFTGRALDLYVGGDPVSTADSNRMVQTRTRIYPWLVRNAERFGFIPYFYEPWHWEYRG
jgi:hypothetical protein